MDSNKDLDDIIKSSFDKRSKGAPEGLWTKLSSTLDAAPQSTSMPHPDPVDEKVKGSFSALSKKAPRDVWPSINKQLNIDQVWRNISQELDRPKQTFWPVFRVAAAVLFLLVSGMGAYISFNNSNIVTTGNTGPYRGASALQGTTTDTIANKSANLNEKAVGSREVLDAPPIVEKGLALAGVSKGFTGTAAMLDSKDNPDQVTPSRQQAKHAEGSSTKSLIASDRTAATASVQVPPQPFNHAISAVPATNQPKPISIIGIGSKEHDPSYSYPEDATLNVKADKVPEADLSESDFMSLVNNRQSLLPKVDSKLSGIEELGPNTIGRQEDAAAWVQSAEEHQQKRKASNVYIGLIVVYHNSWLLNNETKNSFDKNSLISTDPNFKQNYGLTLGFKLTDKSLLAVEAHLINKVGQSYKTFHEGRYLHKNLELHYHKVYVQYQRNFLRYGRNVPGWFTVKAGAYGGYLQAKLGEIRQEESRYNKYDYGLRMVLGQEKQLGKFIIGYGFSAERGLKNIFMGTDRLPARFNKTYIMNFGTYLNCKYSF